MAKKLSRSKIVTKLDTIFSRYVRMSNSDDRGFCTCITCGKQEHWKKIQAGHFMSRKHYSIRWDERNVLPQCLACNVFRAGEQYKYSLKLGDELSEKLLRLSHATVKFSNPELIQKINYYNNLVKELEKEYI
tara:strand:- start:11271 stop:11666 length:396 start_codon:yes stop_codon:yes gene_type:complete